MSITGLFHINITAPLELMEKTKDFYVDVLGLEAGKRPPVERKGYWLYAGDLAIVHLAVPRPEDKRNQGAHYDQGYFDHVALSSTGLAGALDSLSRKKVPFTINVLSGEFSQIQLVVKDPVGTKVELNFQNESLPAAYQDDAKKVA